MPTDFEEMNILDLPVEILIKIFSYISIKKLFNVVILTCKHFNEILTGPGIWEILFAAKFNRHDISADLDYIDQVRNVCLTYEDIWKYWKHDDPKVKLTLANLKGHSSPVDAVHILSGHSSICVSGSRDRNALVWDLREFIHDSDIRTLKAVGELRGHKGWVWSIDSDINHPEKVVTASWDKTLKVWDMNYNGNLLETYQYHPCPVLALSCSQNIYTTGCFQGYLRFFDSRCDTVTNSSRHHKGSLTCLKTTDTVVITGSEDGTVKIYDKRANKVSSSLKFNSPVFCMDVGFDQGFNYLRVGGKNGAYYLYHIDGERLTLLESLQLWENYKVTSLCTFQGSLVVCSQNGCVRMYTPDRQCMLLKKFNTHRADVAACHSYNNLLITGSSDTSLLAWRFFET